jgi:hypothetical protein
MASNKRRGHLDKSTRNHLSGIEAALAHVVSNPRHEDEFTARELYERALIENKSTTISSVFCNLYRMQNAGLCTSRKIKMNGRSTNLYRMIDPDTAK